jgi:hypothetical protein
LFLETAATIVLNAERIGPITSAMRSTALIDPAASRGFAVVASEFDWPYGLRSTGLFGCRSAHRLFNHAAAETSRGPTFVPQRSSSRTGASWAALCDIEGRRLTLQN